MKLAGHLPTTERPAKSAPHLPAPARCEVRCPGRLPAIARCEVRCPGTLLAVARCGVRRPGTLLAVARREVRRPGRLLAVASRGVRRPGTLLAVARREVRHFGASFLRKSQPPSLSGLRFFIQHPYPGTLRVSHFAHQSAPATTLPAAATVPRIPSKATGAPPQPL